jgi:flagellin
VDTSLRDIDKFWDANGKFLLEDPKQITITQGDGRQATFTIYSTDTIESLVTKLNNAIESDVEDGGLGQPSGTTSGQHALFVDTVIAAATNGTLANVAGTIVIKSSVTGAAGRLSFSGDEDLIKALSLNVIQESTENEFTVTVADAHSTTAGTPYNITGNILYGGIHGNIDVEFDSMADIDIDDPSGAGYAFTLTSDTDVYTTYVHLADNSAVFQIGANEGEDMGINIGDMSSHALGLASVLVTDRDSASRSITIIDNAINRVSTQRAKLGAYQNRLEHTINNLTTASTNLKAAESRIRDADMAKEMMEFTKLNVLSQAGNAMLAQANQLPANVLTLIR